MHQHALWQGNKTIYFPGCMCQLTQENNLFPRMHDVSVDSASGMWGGGGRLSHWELIKSIDTCTSLLGSCLLELILNEVTYGHISYWFHLSTRQNHHLERYTITQSVHMHFCILVFCPHFPTAEGLSIVACSPPHSIGGACIPSVIISTVNEPPRLDGSPHRPRSSVLVP